MKIYNTSYNFSFEIQGNVKNRSFYISALKSRLDSVIIYYVPPKVNVQFIQVLFPEVGVFHNYRQFHQRFTRTFFVQNFGAKAEM